MGVLTAVFADPGRIAFDIARVRHGAIKRRRKEQRQTRVTPNELTAYGGHRPRGAGGLCGP